MTIKTDDNYSSAISSLSTAIKGFLTELANGSSLIDWEMLNRNGFRMSDGSYFRVVSGERSFKEQIAEFKKGRKGVKYETILDLFGTRPKKGTKYELLNRGTVTDTTKVTTNAFAGESYHNWGLAVDLVFRKIGEVKELTIDNENITINQFYEKCGLLNLAKKYNLEWGGNWENFLDVAHFEDKNFKIPPKEVWYSQNGNFEFIQWYYHDNETQIKTNWLWVAVFALVVILGLWKWRKK